MMVTEDELLNVLKTTLEKNGQYGKLKAELQVQLMRSLGLDKQLANSQKPQPPSNVSLANQIVCEYLNWAGLKFSEMIFSAEASSNSTQTPRKELCKELNIKDSNEPEKLPLLLTMISSVKQTSVQDTKAG